VNTSALLTDDPGDVVLSSLQLIDDDSNRSDILHVVVNISEDLDNNTDDRKF